MSGKGTLRSFKDMLSQSKRPERIVDICLRGDLSGEFEALERQLAAEQKARLSSLGGGERIDEILDRLEALREEMSDSVVTFRVQALTRPQFRALVSGHPPRRDPETGNPNEADQFIGVNSETFFAALIKACVIEPEMDDEDWSVLLDERLTDKQFDALSDACWSANRGDVDVPFSRIASQLSRSTETE